MSHAPRASHPAIVKRLNHAADHLHSIAGMIEEERPCVDLAQQLQAIENAITSAKRELITEHIDHCLVHAEADSAARRSPSSGRSRVTCDRIETPRAQRPGADRCTSAVGI